MRLTFIPFAIVTSVLVGCGSDDGPAAITDETVQLNDYGVIRIAHDSDSAQTSVDAVFCDLVRSASAGAIDEQYLTAADSCTVTNDGSADSNAIVDLVCSDALPVQTISAGDNLLMSSTAGSYADLIKQTDGDTITYTTGSTLPRPPNGLALNIPGDTFTQFTSVDIPDIEDLEITSPAAGESLSRDTSIRWNAASDRNTSRVLLSASDADVTVTCSLVDDGRFDFSSTTQVSLGDLFAADTLSVRRQNVVSPTRGDSGLIIITSIE